MTLLATWPRYIVLVSLIGVLLIPVSLTLLRSYHLLSYPFEVNYGEGAVVSRLFYLKTQGSYFFDIHHYPFIHGPYPPLFMVASLPIYLVTGSALLATRLVAFISWAGIVIILGRLAYYLWPNLWFASFPPLLWAAAPFVVAWIPLGRVDLLALFLTALALWFLVHTKGDWSRPLLVAIALLIGATLTKHNYQSLPLTVIVSGLAAAATRAWLPRYIGLYGLSLASVALIGHYLTDGQLLLHLFTYNALPLDWSRAARGVRYLLLVTWPTIVLLAMMLPLVWQTLPRRWLWLAYALLSVGTLAGYGKVGADTNYFLEPWFALVAFATAVIAAAAAHPAWRRGLWVIGLFGLALQILMLRPWVISPQLNSIRHWQQTEYPQRHALATLVKNNPGDVLSEDMSVLVSHARPVLFEPFQFLYLARTGHWQPDTLLVDCYRGRFPLIIAGWRLHALPGMRECLRERYGPAQRFGRYWAYQLQPRAPRQ